MARWEEVLDTQLEVHDWLVSDHGKTFGAGYFQSVMEAPGGGDAPSPAWKSSDDARKAGSDWAHRIGVAAFNAEPIYVEPEMMSVCERAIDGFSPEPLAYTDLITPMGFLVLPKSLWLTDPSGNRLSWRAAVWMPLVGDRTHIGRLEDWAGDEGSGIHLTLFHDVDEPDDIDSQDEGGSFSKYLKATGQRWTTKLIPTHVVNWHFGEMHPGDSEHPSEHGFAHDISVDFANDPTQPVMDMNGQVGTSIIKPSTGERAVTAHRQLQGMWRLLTQYLAVPSRQRPPRQALKRAKRAKLPHEHVTIVRLRRPPQDRQPGEPSTVNWTQRWVVGGHWRNQWYPSLGQHRQIWISPYVKGPEDQPLKVNKARIFELVR